MANQPNNVAAEALSAVAMTMSPATAASMSNRGARRQAAISRVPPPLSLIASDATPLVAAATAAASFGSHMVFNPTAASFGASSWTSAAENIMQLPINSNYIHTGPPRSPQGSVSGNFPENTRRTSLGNSGGVPPQSLVNSFASSQPQAVANMQRLMPNLRPRNARQSIQLQPQQYLAPPPQPHVVISPPSQDVAATHGRPAQPSQWVTPPPQQQQQQQQHIHTAPGGHNSRGSDAAHLHPQFRNKTVCQLTCRHCTRDVCQRGMKAILLADTRVELYSTDMPLKGAVELIQQDYVTSNCHCRIRDVACLGCGNCIGYHVTQACETCLEACNNGHFWMFHSDGVAPSDRYAHDGKVVLWGQLPSASMKGPEPKNLHSRSNTSNYGWEVGACSAATRLHAATYGGMSVEQIRLALLCLDEHIAAPCLNEPGASAAHEHWAACH